MDLLPEDQARILAQEGKAPVGFEMGDLDPRARVFPDKLVAENPQLLEEEEP